MGRGGLVSEVRDLTLQRHSIIAGTPSLLLLPHCMYLYISIYTYMYIYIYIYL